MEEEEEEEGGSVTEDEEEVVEVNVSPPAPRVAGKRRRLLNTENIANVPIYTGRVNRTLHLFHSDLDHKLWKQVNDSDSEDEGEREGARRKRRRLSPESVSSSDSDTGLEKGCCLLSSPGDRSPSPPSSPPLPPRQTRRALNAIREVNQTLGELDDFRSLPLSSCGSEEVVGVGTLTSPTPHTPRQLTLKLRCRGTVHKMPLRVTDPLQNVVDQLAVKLDVNPSSIVLLRNESEISPQETPESGNIGIADILDCLIASELPGEDSKDVIRLKVQGVARDSVQFITICKGEPMKKLMDVYRDIYGLDRSSVRFLFDGEALPETATPRQLDIEPDDVIDVRDVPPSSS